MRIATVADTPQGEAGILGFFQTPVILGVFLVAWLLKRWSRAYRTCNRFFRYRNRESA